MRFGTMFLVVSVFLLAMASQGRADTVYGPDQHPLVIRHWCVHLTGSAFVSSDSLGKRRVTPAVQVGGSFLRFGALRLPVIQLGMAEADQSQERLKDATGILGSVGVAWRTGEWDNGKFEVQFHAAYTRDLRSGSNGITIGFGIGF